MINLSQIHKKLQAVNIITESGKRNPRFGTILPKHPHIEQEIVESTSYLDSDTELAIRILCIMLNQDTRPQCKSCANQVKWIAGKAMFATFCSTKCSNSDKEKQEAQVSTKRELYGENYERIVEKMEATTLEKYGVEHTSKLPEVMDKVRATTQERYGVDSYTQTPEYLEKSKATNMARYGVEHISHLPEYHQNKQQANLERTGYCHNMQDPNHLKFREELSTQKHGTAHPMQLDEVKNKVYATNMERYGHKHYQTYRIHEDTLKILQDGDALRDLHIAQKKSISMLANELGSWHTTIKSYLLAAGIDIQHYRGTSSGENAVYNMIVNELGIDESKILRNDRTEFGCEVDIYLPEYNIAIEYCGLYWHSEQMGRGPQYHKAKFIACAKKGVQLITIFDDEWIKTPHIVKGKIASLLNVDRRPTVFARKTEIIRPTIEDKREFFNEFHIQGDGSGSLVYGLSYGGEMVACIAFMKLEGGEFLLNRYCTSKKVVGGFSKLLKYFKDNVSWNKITTFADNRWSDGRLYQLTGFSVSKILPPDYYYSANGHDRVHKFNYRRKNLPKLLSHFDENLSEWENCKANNVLRIWDCGKIKFEME